MAQTIRHYEIVGTLGSGGMGVVYKARDTTLGRFVALKFLPVHAERSADRVLQERLIQEARAASSLDHPNIGVVHEAGHSDDGQPFIAMGYYEGDTLKDLIERRALEIQEALSIARQLALGLSAAHARGIVHRDIKPGNVIVTPEGVAKIIDFGIATLSGATHLTNEGSVVGTPAYMAPEQARGDDTDARSDLWSLCVVLFEMLAGRPPFKGGHDSAVINAILNDSPPRLSDVKPGVPKRLDQMLSRGLEKDADKRYQTAQEFLKDLEEAATPKPAARASGRRTLAMAAAVAVAVLAVGVAGVAMRREANARWARDTALPRLQALVDAGDNVTAFDLATQIESLLPDDPQLPRLWDEIAGYVAVTSTPAGADVYVRAYEPAEGPWRRLGSTPLQDVRIPRATLLRWRIEKGGSAPIEFSRTLGGAVRPTIDMPLDPEGTGLPGMIHVPVGSGIPGVSGLDHFPALEMSDFWIDALEVSNRDYKRFVDAGGYARREFWVEPFVADGRSVPWQDGISRFRDATGRPGPAAWESGAYPSGHDDHPVTGVSWYEAAAFAKFAGKSLPTVYHWTRASGSGSPAGSLIAIVSNLDARDGASVPSPHGRGLGPFGTWNMAGNAKEWVLNEGRDGARYLLGGAWNEPGYMFIVGDAQSPWSREPTYGFRCVDLRGRTLAAAFTGPMLDAVRDYRTEQAVPEATFRGFARMFAYDKRDLRASLEATDRSAEAWRRETVSFDAGYGAERVTAYVYIPTTGAPPFQTVIYAPGSNALHERDIARHSARAFDFLIRSGRAVVLPVFKGTFHRGTELDNDSPAETSLYRDHVVAWVRDLNRTVDYLETRTDLDLARLGYFGFSWGGALPQLIALEPRLKANVLVAGAYYFTRAYPEVDQINFVPRVTTPTLVINGKTDLACPVETCAVPFFQHLGSHEPRKRLVITDSGHFPPRNEMIKQSLDWFDLHLGRVQ